MFIPISMLHSDTVLRNTRCCASTRKRIAQLAGEFSKTLALATAQRAGITFTSCRAATCSHAGSGIEYTFFPFQPVAKESIEQFRMGSILDPGFALHTSDLVRALPCRAACDRDAVTTRAIAERRPSRSLISCPLEQNVDPMRVSNLVQQKNPRLVDQIPSGQFGRYLLVGAWNTIFGYGSFAFFTKIL